MLVRPTLQELERKFSDGADYYIFNAGEFHANQNIAGAIVRETVSLNLQQ
jgi:hypothetical protein